MTIIMMTDNLAAKITISNLQITLSRHYEIRKDFQKYGQLFLLFLLNQEKFLVVSGKYLKNFSEQVHF